MRDREQAIGVERDALVEPKLLFEAFAPQAKRPFAARRELAFEVLDVAADGGGRFGRGIGQVAEQVQIARDRRTRAADPRR